MRANYAASASSPPAREEFVSIVDCLHDRCRHAADAVALRFLQNGRDETCRLTYADLDAKVRPLAARLQQSGLTGEPVLLLTPTGPEYLISLLACLAVGAVAVPLFPPRANRLCSRWEGVVLDAQPRAALVTQETSTETAQWLALSRCRHDVEIIACDVPRPEWDSSWSPPVRDPSAPGYLQYTSGSTSAPKGVVITQSNLVSNCRSLAAVAGEDVDHVGVTWLPLHHDMGLVGALFVMLYLGRPLVLMPPEAFVMRPIVWLQAISRYRGTLSPAPNFAFDLCMRRITPEQKAALDLSSWCVAFNGAERVNSHSLVQFSAAFQSCGFRPETFCPCYGLAESTLFVAGKLRHRRPTVRRFDNTALAGGQVVESEIGVDHVSCGQPHEGDQVLVVDPDTRRRCPPGHVGEIWISSPSVAGGYWQQQQRSDEVFNAFEEESGAGPFLRTGDLGFLYLGELYVTGRLKDLIIMAGHNIAPEDIEGCIEAADAAVCSGRCVAFAVNEGSREQLVVVAEVERQVWRQLDRKELARTLRDAVVRQHDEAIHDLVLVRSRTLPRTPNGKKQRAICRQAYINGDLTSGPEHAHTNTQP